MRASWLGILSISLVQLGDLKSHGQALDDNYDVASIRPTPTESQENVLGFGRGLFRARGITLRKLVVYSYDVRSFQVVGGPNWIDARRYDIEAKTSDVSGNQLHDRARLQRLLADRFQLVVAKEFRPQAVYFLEQDRNGAKIQNSRDTRTKGSDFAGQIGVLPGSIDAKMVSMPLFARALAQQLERPVIDKTGLEGPYDFHLDFDSSNLSTPNVQHSEANHPSLFQALKETLGLALRIGKEPVEMIIIRRANEPSEN